MIRRDCWVGRPAEEPTGEGGIPKKEEGNKKGCPLMRTKRGLKKNRKAYLNIEEGTQKKSSTPEARLPG